MNKIFKSLLFILAPAMLLASCEQSKEVLEEVEYSRVLTPMKFSAEVVPSTGTDVVLTWQKIKNADGYELQIFEQTDDEQAINAVPDGQSPVDFYTLSTEDVPFTVYGLEVDKTFFARVRGVSASLGNSNWAYLEKTFSTSAVRDPLNPVIVSRTSSEVTLSWDDADDKADLTSVKVEFVVPREGETSRTLALSTGEIAAGSVTVGELAAGREYRFTLLFGKAGNRGSITACTRPVIDGTPITVTTGAELLNAIDNQSGTIKVLVDYVADGLNVTEAYPDATKKFATIVGDVSIYGNSTEAGVKPVVSGLVFDLNSGATSLHLEDVAFDGAGTGAIVENISAAMTSIETINCEISNYAKGIYSVASGASGASVANYLIDGSYVHDINADGSQGGDFIDIRAAENGDIIVRNTTFYACARTFFRISDNAKVENVLAENCTFNYVTATPSSSNNAGIFAVRVVTGAKSVKAVKNVFLNEYSDKENESTSWVRLCRNSTDSYRVVCEDNVYYNVGAAWFVSNAVPTDTDALGDATFETVALTGATVLESDPCVNSEAGKLYLSGTAGDQIKSLKAGDPRWWDAVQPVIVRETELTVAEDETTWDFTEKTIYDTEELTANTIIGNARIFATATVPANVVMSKGIDFSTGASVSPEGVPTYSAVEVLTNGYGSVKVTADSEDGIGSLQVLAGGDRYAVLADGEEHTVNLGDLSGENSIYVIANSAITLKKIVWTKDLTPESAVEVLAAPTVVITPGKIDAGTEEDIVISWNAIANAADYVLTFNGTESVLTEPGFTIPAADAAALAVGDYTVTVKARPVATSSKYAESEVAEATLKVNKVVVGGEVTLTWDFSSAAWQTELAAKGAANADITNWVSTVDGLTWTSTQKSKWNKSGDVYFIQAGGNSNGSDRYFSFTAPAAGKLVVTVSNTGSSEDLTRLVNVSVDGGTAQTVPGGVASNGTPKACEFDIEAGEVKIFASGNALRYYKIEFTYVGGAAPGVNYDWNFSDTAWQTELAAKGAANADITNWVSTVDGLTWTSTQKSKWNKSGDVYFIQAGGNSNGSDRYFSFTAPAAGKLVVTVSNTGSSEDLTRLVNVSVDGGAAQTVPGGVASNGTPKECEFEIEAGEVKIFASGNALRFYRIKFEGVGGGAPAKFDNIWDISSAEWQAALQEAAPTAKGSNQAGWTVTVDGLSYTSSSKNGKWDTTYIQPNGAGDSTDRVFKFNTPADGTLTVTACTPTKDAVRSVCVVDSSSSEAQKKACTTDGANTELEFDVVAGDVFIYPDAGVRFFKFEFHSN